MRGLGEVSQAVLEAAKELFTPARAGTLAEIQHRACVSTRAAKATVQNLTRAGRLVPVRAREVDYRNRKVMEYAPCEPAAPQEAPELDRVMTQWVSR